MTVMGYDVPCPMHNEWKPWIPAFAGMTEQVQTASQERVLGIMGKVRLARATRRGVQRGETPLRSLPSPKIGGLGVDDTQFGEGGS